VSDDLVTRGEFELLRQMVSANETRIASIDQSGTRGVGIVQQQLTDVVKDLVELKAEMNARFDAHMKTHEQDERDRVSARRYTLTTVIAALAIIVGLLLNITLHLR
jgi:hypothetical protein